MSAKLLWIFILFCDIVLISNKGVLCQDFGSFGDYMMDWYNRYTQMSERMYPFGTRYGDQNASTEVKQAGGFDPSISFQVPYYGVTYQSVYISVHGHLSFSVGKPAKKTFYSPAPWPNPLYPNNTDPAFAAIFFGETDFRPTTPGEMSHLSWRILDPAVGSSAERWITEGVLSLMSYEVRAGVVGADRFDAKYGLLVTWFKPTFLGSHCDSHSSDLDSCYRNTYQMALITDQVETHVIFNYRNVSWVGGASQKCDVYTGRPSSSAPKCLPAWVGFNAGNGRGFYPLPYSNTARLVDIDVLGGSNVTGRFINKISGDRVVRGGCTNDTSVGGVWAAEVYPNFGSNFGGHEVNVSGPCFTMKDNIRCRFDDVEVDGHYNSNMMKAACYAPRMDKLGLIKVWVSADGGGSYHFSTDYSVVPMEYVRPKVVFSDYKHDWLNVAELQLNWSPHDVTPHVLDKIRVNLWGYTEWTEDGQPQVKWRHLHTFMTDASNQGYYKINVQDANNRCKPVGDTMCKTYKLGVFDISVVDSDPTSPRRAWSQIIPLAWFIKDTLEKTDTANWKQVICRDWYGRDTVDGSWRDHLEPCPCTLNQAYNEFGRFQPDAKCFRGSTFPDNCKTNAGALHCVRTTHPTRQHGSGTQCCYNQRGDLMYIGDSNGGGKAERCSSLGVRPYKSLGRIPFMSHWYADMVPYYACCVWSDDKECSTHFIPQRPTPDCKNYRVAGHGTAFGDPHFTTFDGLTYTFNGKGEFLLLYVTGVSVGGELTSFSLQGRFEQPSNHQWGQVKATVMTSVAMQEGDVGSDNPVVEIRLNTHSLHTRLAVYVDGVMREFLHEDSARQHFKDVKIINNDPAQKIQSNFTVVFRCGMGVQVAYSNHLLHVITATTADFYDNTGGLFGSWNNMIGDDLTPRGDPKPPPISHSDTVGIHYTFGLSWQATESESRFLYSVGLNYQYFNHRHFAPEFQPQIPSNSSGVSESQIQAVCGGDVACTYDYRSTLNENIARSTLTIQAWSTQVKSMAQEVKTCGWLHIPNSVKKEPYSYIVGSVVTITGCKSGYVLEGPTRTYSCTAVSGGTPQWTPPINLQCRSVEDVQTQTTTMAIAIGVPAGILFIVLVLGIVACCCHCCRNRPKKMRKADVDNDIIQDDGGSVLYPTGGHLKRPLPSVDLDPENGKGLPNKNETYMTTYERRRLEKKMEEGRNGEQMQNYDNYLKDPSRQKTLHGSNGEIPYEPSTPEKGDHTDTGRSRKKSHKKGGSPNIDARGGGENGTNGAAPESRKRPPVAHHNMMYTDSSHSDSMDAPDMQSVRQYPQATSSDLDIRQPKQHHPDKHPEGKPRKSSRPDVNKQQPFFENKVIDTEYGDLPKKRSKEQPTSTPAEKPNPQQKPLSAVPDLGQSTGQKRKKRAPLIVPQPEISAVSRRAPVNYESDGSSFDSRHRLDMSFGSDNNSVFSPERPSPIPQENTHAGRRMPTYRYNVNQDTVSPQVRAKLRHEGYTHT